MNFVKTRQFWMYVFVFVLAAMATAGVAALLVNIQTKQQEATAYPLQIVEIPEGEIDPAVWGQNYPVQYDSFRKTDTDVGQTGFGGSDPYSKLERNPAMTRL
jgi:nitrite reductase (cytochrome c-552)